VYLGHFQERRANLGGRGDHAAHANRDKHVARSESRIAIADKTMQAVAQWLGSAVPLYAEGLGFHSVRVVAGSRCQGGSGIVIRHHILIRKYDIIAVPPFPETMHKRRKPIFWAPGRVLHKLDDTRMQINVSDRLLPKIM